MAGGIGGIEELDPLSDAGVSGVLLGEVLFTGAIDLAATLLAEGRARTEKQRSGARIAAGAGWAGALLATFGARDPRLSRRTLLRTAVQLGGLAALTPGVGYTLVAEVFTPDELRVFDQLLARLYGLVR